MPQHTHLFKHVSPLKIHFNGMMFTNHHTLHAGSNPINFLLTLHIRHALLRLRPDSHAIPPQVNEPCRNLPVEEWAKTEREAVNIPPQASFVSVYHETQPTTIQRHGDLWHATTEVFCLLGPLFTVLLTLLALVAFLTVPSGSSPPFTPSCLSGCLIPNALAHFAPPLSGVVSEGCGHFPLKTKRERKKKMP